MNKYLNGLAVGAALATGLLATAPAFAAGFSPSPLYFTANYGSPSALHRERAPINTNGITESYTSSQVKLSAPSGESAGFVAKGPLLGNVNTKTADCSSESTKSLALCAVQVRATSGSKYTIALWIDTKASNDISTNGDWFNWSGALSSSTMNKETGSGGDALFVAQVSPKGNGNLTVGGGTEFKEVVGPNPGPTQYTLNELQTPGNAAGTKASDPVAVELYSTNTSATITSFKIDSDPVPVGQLPEAPWAVGIPVVGIGVGTALWLRKRRLA